MSTGLRVKALRRFAVATTLLNVFGHFVLGFEVPWIQPLVALFAAYVTELVLEGTRAWGLREEPRYNNKLVEFLLPAHITGMTVSMFLYSGAQMWPIAFASALSIACKYLFRIRIEGQERHFLNPSNTGLIITLALFGEVTVSAPWQFLRDTYGYADLLLPVLILVSGGLLNWQLTKKIPLIAAWLGVYVLQGVVRDVFFDANFFAILFVATGPIALLFTFYMVSDPGTTPQTTKNQIWFGASVGALYGVITCMHITYSLFWALLVVCIVRGMYHLAKNAAAKDQRRVESLESKAESTGDIDHKVAV